MALLREHHDDRKALVSRTADALGIGEVFVEKDFWVTEVLRAATASIELEARDGSRHPVSTIFKGGTSLSRVHGLIDRFSEDVDLLIGFPGVDASAGAKERVLKGRRGPGRIMRRYRRAQRKGKVQLHTEPGWRLRRKPITGRIGLVSLCAGPWLRTRNGSGVRVQTELR